MNIGMIVEGDFPPDIRIEKEADILISKGFNIFLLSGIKQGNEGKYLYKNIVVEKKIVRYHFFLKREWDKIKFYLGKYTLFHKYIELFCKKYNIHVLHAHDLPICFIALKVAKKQNIPIIFDMHENYPYYKMVDKKNKRKFKYWCTIEKMCCERSNFIITTCEEMKERIVKMHNVEKEKVFVVSNYYHSEFQNLKVNEEILKRYRDKFLILYVGRVAPHKGCDTAIKAMEFLKNYSKILLCIVGIKGSKYEKKLLEIILHLGLKKKVELIPWTSLDNVYSYILASSVCLLPFNRNMQTDCSSPHKLFQYMYTGKPVVVSDCPSFKRIVEDAKCGLTFRGGDSENLAKKILLLYKDKKMRMKMGKNGRDAVEKKYNFEETGKQLLLLYRNLSKIISK